MSLLDIFRRKAAREATPQIPIVDRISMILSKTFGSNHSNAEMYTGWVFAAVQAIAEQMAVIDLRLYKKNKTGEREQVFKHPALDLLSSVNDYMTRYDLFFRVGANIELQGNEKWFIFPNKLGQPAEIFPLRPEAVKTIVDKYGKVEGYRYVIDAKAYLLPPELVVPFRNFNPRSDFEGMGTLEAARLTAETDESSKQFDKSFNDNFARPDIILKFSTDLKAEQKTALKEAFRSEYSGSKNAGKMLIAPKGMEVDTLSPNHADMEFVEKRRLNREEILGIFRVPKTILGLTEDVNRASAEAAMYAFVLFTCTPKYHRIINSLNEFFLPMFADGEEYVFDFANKPPEDPESLINEITAGIAGGVYTINDGRRMRGLAEVDNGDEIFLSFGLTPYTSVTKKSAPQPKVKIIQADIDFSELATKIVEGSKVQKKEAGRPAIDLPQEAPKVSMTKEVLEEKGLAKVTARDEMLKDSEAEFKKTSNKLFDDQKSRAIAALKKSKNLKSYGLKGSKAASDVLEVDKEIKMTVDLYTPLFKALVAQAGQEALDAIDAGAFDVDKAGDFIKSNTLRMAKSMTLKTVTDLRTLIGIGVDQGESVDTIAARIADYSGFSTARSETIARTETIRGSSQADLEAWKQSEVVKSLTWYTALDDRVDDDCMYLQGKEVSLGDEFLTEGQLREFGIEPYGSLDAPPLHPNCRCTLIPVLSEN